MKKKKLALYIFCAICAILFVVEAFVDKDDKLAFYSIYSLLARFIKLIGQGSTFKNVLGWIVYFILGLAPIAFPIVRTCKNKKADLISILLYIFVPIHLFTLYVYINPELFVLNPLVTGDNYYLAVAGMGIASIMYLLVVIILYGYMLTKKNTSFAFDYANAIIDTAVFVCIYGVFYALPHSAYVSILQATDHVGGIIAYEVIKALISLASFGLTVYILNSIHHLIGNMSKDLFAEENQKRLVKLQKLSFISALVPFVSAILVNVLTFGFVNILTNVSYSAELDFTGVICALLCLCLLVFVNESYKIKKDNDLTI